MTGDRGVYACISVFIVKCHNRTIKRRSGGGGGGGSNCLTCPLQAVTDGWIHQPYFTLHSQEGDMIMDLDLVPNICSPGGVYDISL